MAATVRIEHNGAGWIEVFKSAGMQAVVDAAGEQIAASAGEHFYYSPAKNSNFTAAGFVAATEYTGAWLEATQKVLTKAVHG